MSGLCVYCNRPVEGGYRRVVGWERKGSGMQRKGGSDIVLREVQREVACGPCITRLRTGVNADQGALL